MHAGEHRGRLAPGDRGLWDFGRIVDSRGTAIVVRRSSSAEQSAVWLFVTDSKGQSVVEHCGQWVSVSPHLGLREAKLLRDALNRFIDGETRGGGK